MGGVLVLSIYSPPFQTWNTLKDGTPEPQRSAEATGKATPRVRRLSYLLVS